MSFEFRDLAEQIKSGQPISAHDTLALRQWAWASDGMITPHEAESLFELNNLGKSTAPEWVDMFVEAISEYIVNQEAPKGYISEANAAWLIAQIDRDGKVDSLAELELLVKVLERALNAPDALKDYALTQIETVVLTGEGPTRRGGDIHAGQIDEAEVVLLRRLIFASGGSGPAEVRQDEAEMLFRIKDATLGAANAAGWQQLFVQGVGNYLMTRSSHLQLTREQAVSKEAFMNDTTVNVGRFLDRMSKAAPDWQGAHEAVFDNDDLDEIAARVAADGEAAKISAFENAWLSGATNADGAQDDLERALIAFLREG
jgi:hypothetical protein